MSGATIGGAVGAVVGFWVGGPQGAQWGWMIGSTVGGYVDPTQIEGPRLQDARTQTSRDGIAIPFGWGTFPLAGNVIAQGPVVERKKKERQGKGGPEVTTYTYTRTYAIGLCEGPITGLLQIKRNGKVVYDARTDAEIEEELTRGGYTGLVANLIAKARASNSAFMNKATIYLGDETQMPDPALEAIFGAGNVPAHRGLPYFVVEDDDVTDLAGAIPQYEVVVASCGETSQFNGAGIYWNANDRSYVAGDYGVDLADGSRTAWPWDVTESFGTSQIVGVRGTIYRNAGARYFEVEILGDVSVWEAPLADVCVGVGRLGSDFLNATNNNDSAYVTYFNPNTLAFKCGTESSAENHTLSAGGRIGVLVSFDSGEVPVVWFSYNGTWIRNPPTVPGGIFAGSSFSELPAGSYAPLFFMGVNYTQSQSAPLVKLHQFQDELLFQPVGVPAWGEDGIGTPVPGADGWYILPDGTLVGAGTSSGIVAPCAGIPLSTIFADVCERRGIVADEREVSQLTDLVPGFVVARETDAASIIQSLMPAYFFDVGEWDGKLRGIKRGGTAVGAINGDDLVERDGDAFERERVQEAELLRRVTVGYNDPQAAYSLTTQKWERRAGTVQALGEASVELPLTLNADDAATIAKRRGLTAWGEPEKQKFSLPYRLGKYTPTDILNYTDDDGLVHTIRLMDLQDDSGVRYVESSMNSAEAYGATATGVVPRPPSITEPALRGPTLLAVMDLPLWRSSDADTLGLYVAGCGYLAGWQGAQVDVSTDGGVSYVEAAQVTVPATIGTTTTALVADASSEYPSIQTLTVMLPDAPESVSYEALLRYNNRAALQLADGRWEILQYQTVVANGANSYTLSGLVRGRYATTPGAAAAGATFVLLDAAVQFVPVERHLLGDTLKVRATTYGTSSDAAVASDFAFTDGASQAEWPVHGVTATRDGDDNVTVTWIGRARLGVETAPYHSTNFTGYRVSWDDGTTVTTADATAVSYTITAAADPIDVTVTPLNSITGAGPASEAITV